MNQSMVLTAVRRPQRRDRDHADELKTELYPGPMEPRIILIDDDPVYGAVISRWAAREGVALDVFHSLDDLGFVGLLAQYDVAIVDYDLGAINGRDVADYMMTLFGNKPMIMISGMDRSTELANCPACVKAFMNKSVGYEKILETALKLRQHSEIEDT
jgi:CheY-like chemotaxis protein